MSGQSIITDTPCMETNVTLTLYITPGTIHSSCINNPADSNCSGIPAPSQTAPVNRCICLRIPLTVSAALSAQPVSLASIEPDILTCVLPTACTFSSEYFQNHPDLTNALIRGAGGSITLGADKTGLSLAVTIENANSVLSMHTPSPPVPADPTYADQYQNLYAQLLTAKLNMLNGAIGAFAADAIMAAYAFLAHSPKDGKAGAPSIQKPLMQYNAGIAPGCPPCFTNGSCVKPK